MKKVTSLRVKSTFALEHFVTKKASKCYLSTFTLLLGKSSYFKETFIMYTPPLSSRPYLFRSLPSPPHCGYGAW